uniref:Thioredoxin domain-containing protein 12 n=1 Tax=Triatoma infestans TaxID=30076 RepID=A0A170Y7C4_TRIIF
MICKRDVMWSRCKSLIIQFVHAKTNDEWFGTRIKFFTMEDGLAMAKKLQRPIMVIVHHELCEACRAFRPLISNSTPIVELSSYFVMVGVEEEFVPEMLKIDGNYTPKVIFLSPDGQVQPQFFNRFGNPRYKYFYHNDRSVLFTMKRVLTFYPPPCEETRPCYYHGGGHH